MPKTTTRRRTKKTVSVYLKLIVSRYNDFISFNVQINMRTFYTSHLSTDASPQSLCDRLCICVCACVWSFSPLCMFQVKDAIMFTFFSTNITYTLRILFIYCLLHSPSNLRVMHKCKYKLYSQQLNQRIATHPSERTIKQTKLTI